MDVRSEVSKVCVYCWYLLGSIFNQVKGHGKHAHTSPEHTCTCTHAHMHPHRTHVPVHVCTRMHARARVRTHAQTHTQNCLDLTHQADDLTSRGLLLGRILFVFVFLFSLERIFKSSGPTPHIVDQITHSSPEVGRDLPMVIQQRKGIRGPEPMVTKSLFSKHLIEIVFNCKMFLPGCSVFCRLPITAKKTHCRQC